MSVAVVVAILGLCSAFGAAWFAYKTSKRVNSGTTATSSAADLWEEGRSQRDGLSAALEKANGRLDVATAKLDLSNGKLDAALAQITELLHEVELAHASSDQARADLRRSHEETVLSRAETKALSEQMAAQNGHLARAVADIHADVRTGNALSAGQLLDNQETRRIDLLEESDKTDADREHVSQVGIQTHSAIDSQGDNEDSSK